MKKTSHYLALTAIGAVCLLVTACGGGGSSAVSTPMPSGVNAPGSPAMSPTGQTITNPGASQTDALIGSVGAVPASNYTGEELDAYTTFSTARTTCGFGPLKQSTIIDTAAAGHVNWQAVNNYAGHFQISGTPGFTGVTSLDRILAAGYPQNWRTATEVITSFSNTPKAGFGSLGARTLLSAPYHLMGIVGADREIGLSIKSSGATGADITVTGFTPRVILVANMASSAALPPQYQAASDVLTYPCAGVTGTAYQLLNESPNPIPSRDLRTNPIGQPIFVRAGEGKALAITSVSVTGPTGTVTLEPTMTSANDPNAELLPNMAMIMPSGPLAKNTSYSVSISGTSSGTPFTRNFTFMTGS